jgi:hypothetical protein
MQRSPARILILYIHCCPLAEEEGEILYKGGLLLFITAVIDTETKT